MEGLADQQETVVEKWHATCPSLRVRRPSGVCSQCTAQIFTGSPKTWEGVVVSEETEVKAVLTHTNPTWRLNKFLIRAWMNRNKSNLNVKLKSNFTHSHLATYLSLLDYPNISSQVLKVLCNADMTFGMFSMYSNCIWVAVAMCVLQALLTSWEWLRDCYFSYIICVTAAVPSNEGGEGKECVKVRSVCR